ncbi:MAG: GAF domain-containing protein, partial [Gemmatimonadota bacterium]
MTAPGVAATPFEGLGDKHLRQLLYASHAFNSTIDLEVLIPRILDMVVETCEAEAGSLWVLDGDALQCHYAVGPEAQQVMWIEIPLGAGVVGDAALNRRAELIPDVSKDPRFLHQIDEMTGFVTRSVIAVPLVANDQLYGAIELVNPRAGAAELDEEDLHFVEAIADDAAAAFRTAKLFEAETRARDLRALLEVSHEITSTFDLDRVLISIVNLAGRALRFDRCVLAVWQDEKLQVRGISGEAALDRRASSIRELESFLTWAAARGEIVSVPDVNIEEDETAAELRSRFSVYLETAAVHGFLMLPIKDSEGELGVLHLEFAQPTQLAQWELEAGELLANQAALAIRNAQLYANVPFISWLEPLRAKKEKLIALPGPAWLAYGGLALAVALLVSVVPMPARVSAPRTAVRALVQQPARAQISGIVTEVLVREGQAVQRGAAIARLQNETLLRQWREAAGERQVAERTALAADARGDAGAAALARVRLAEASEAERLRARELQRSTIAAPASGVVLTPRVHERAGSYVNAGDTIAWIGDADWAELEMQV